MLKRFRTALNREISVISWACSFWYLFSPIFGRVFGFRFLGYGFALHIGGSR